MTRRRRRLRRALAALLVVLAVASGVLIARDGRSGFAGSTPADVAYRQFKEAGKLFDCLDAYDTVLTAGASDTFDVPKLRRAARAYADRSGTYLATLAHISFPPEAAPVAEEIQQTVTGEVANLRLLSGISTRADAVPLLNLVYYAEAAFNALADELREALGRQVPQATRALSRLELARQTVHRDTLVIQSLFSSAISAGDLEAAKNVSNVERELLQDFSDTLDAIDFPDGFGDRVADVKAKIGAEIRFVMRQVDVPDTSKIVPTPPEGSAEFQARERAAATLSDDLAKVDPPQTSAPEC